MTSFGIGVSVKRREDVRLVTGQGRYAEDWNVPGQAYAAFVRSPHAHADVVEIDVAAAQKIAGVLAVFTGRDLIAGGVGPIPTLIAERGGGIRNRDGSPFAEPVWYSLATDRVRHAGEPVAMVIAETPAAAQDGAGAVTVRYAERPAVVDAVAALAAGAPSLHSGVARNRAYDWECGDAEATARAIATAAHVTRLRLIDNRLITCFLEPRAALAEWDAAAGRYTLHASLQSVHALAANLARILGVAREHVRCVTGDVGGGFGSKIQPYPEYVALAFAARRLGRPLKWVSSRIEGFSSDAQSRDHVLEGELALDAAGRVIALRVHSTTNLGAYVAPSIPISTLTNMERMISGLYAIPAIHLRVEGALTNTVPINVYRGVGRFECVYTVERLIERAARETGRDPVALRRANMVSTFPYRTATGAVYDSGDYIARLDEATERADVVGFEARRGEAKQRGKLRGIAVGPYVEGTGGVPHEYAEVRVLPTGVVEVPIGSQSHGQGHETVFAQVVAEHLGVPFERVSIVMGDTDRVAKGVGTFASRSMLRAGNAAVEAVDAVVAAGKTMAAHLLEAAAPDIEYHDGAFRVVGTDRSIGIFDVARAAADGKLPHALGTTLGAATMHENPAFAFANGCEVCELEVDPETGAVEIVALTMVDDSGRSVNPMIVHGQQHGAVAQGIGQALIERCVYDPASGQLLTGSFLDYAIPRAADLPSIAVTSRDVPSPTNALGVKGAGEGGTVGAPGAVIHAILDALAPLGVEHIDMPATPERVWRAIRDARSTEGASERSSANRPACPSTTSRSGCFDVLPRLREQTSEGNAARTGKSDPMITPRVSPPRRSREPAAPPDGPPRRRRACRE
ncbi:MAG: carbon monoxide dehydrogenase [Candidatus Rokuibacteriota bacterium]|nr:MAG: carbon monoxide dehydrogenase [Candidatus Rokubacteria bacterium]